MDIALLTYNVIVPDRENNWYDSIKEKGNRLLLLQKQPSVIPAVLGDRSDDSREIPRIIRMLWDNLLVYNSAKGIDKVFIYLGGAGAEEFIVLVAQCPELFANQGKITFLICPCRQSQHEDLIKQYGLGGAHIVAVDCGGVNEMRVIYYHFLGTPTPR